MRGAQGRAGEERAERRGRGQKVGWPSLPCVSVFEKLEIMPFKICVYIYNLVSAQEYLNSAEGQV